MNFNLIGGLYRINIISSRKQSKFEKNNKKSLTTQRTVDIIVKLSQESGGKKALKKA